MFIFYVIGIIYILFFNVRVSVALRKVFAEVPRTIVPANVEFGVCLVGFLVVDCEGFS